MTIALQQCQVCGTVQYPTRAACRSCLSPDLVYQPVDDGAKLLVFIDLHASLDPLFSAYLPWRIGTLALTAGPVVIAHIVDASLQAGDAARVTQVRDFAGRTVLIATAPNAAVPSLPADLFPSQE